jgi:hypothetical protein
MLHGIDNILEYIPIEYLGIFCEILSIPQNIIMNLNNVMWMGERYVCMQMFSLACGMWGVGCGVWGGDKIKAMRIGDEFEEH